ncbi:MAG: hypothetical protein OJF52_001687 [Nitrospira sp.]|nr:MAG: hypothetical protein OJF52_001687 [Nitrospira sp.]
MPIDPLSGKPLHSALAHLPLSTSPGAATIHRRQNRRSNFQPA